MVWEFNKYKDEQPIKTIHKARAILSKIGLVPMETQWENSVKGYYSVSLKIENTTLRSNGKGTTVIYALASAYGELMERLQNFAPFRLGMDFSSAAFKSNGFCYAPDEKEINIEDLVNENNEWLELQNNELENKKRLLELWKNVTDEDIQKDFIALPYVNLNTKNISYIPAKMVCKMYMSNGMSAGNSIEEALIQGISETFERYINAIIINKRITPPDIPRDYLKNYYPNLINMIREIESTGKFKLLIKDCSLGLEYPVVCIILVDTSESKYYVKFGSFPKIEIAIERTLTEMLQGQDLNKMKSMTEFNYSNDVRDKHDNLLSIFVNGIGSYPIELFLDKPTYEFKPIDRFKGESSRELFFQVFRFIKERGYNLFVRDVSFLNFPAFHIIIPNLSEIENIDDEEVIAMYSRFTKIKKLIRNLNNLKEENILELINLLSYKKYHPLMPVADFLRLDINKEVPWYFTNLAFFKTALNCKVKNYDEAYKSFTNFLDCIQDNSQMVIPYYKCVKYYLKMKAEARTDEFIINLMNKVFPQGMINNIILGFESDNIFNNEVNIFQCFDCSNCELRDGCNYKNNEKVYKRLKQEYFHNKIEQEKILDRLIYI